LLSCFYPEDTLFCFSRVGGSVSNLRVVLFFAILVTGVAQQSTVPRSREVNDAGRFFAGLPAEAGSSFARFETGVAWKEHRRRLDAAWGKAEAGLIGGLRDFQKQELGGAPLANSTVFYPFGGPDALTATLCFPRSPMFVIVGLEPAGTLPTAEQLAKKDMPGYLGGLRETTASVLGRSFFITREMDHQFRGQVTDGLLVPILHLLSRTQHTVLGFRYVRLDDDGRVIAREADYKAPTRFGNKGVEIEFRSNTDQATQKLYYFSVNLSDERLRENKPFLAYASRLKGTTTLLKATSYMTHRADFSLVRELLLSNSAAILQDDSGIPYRLFQPALWKVSLYGDYDHPFGSFRWLAQADLRKAYQTNGGKPLGFRIGYGYARIPSNLLLAKRIQVAATATTGVGAR
jgi:hypothetical protein